MKIIKDLKLAAMLQPAKLPNFEIVGVIEQDFGQGALALCKSTGRYVQLNMGASKNLDQRKVKALLDITNNAGAPKKMESGKRRNIYIDDADLEKLKAIGKGNASAGLRALLRGDC